VNHQKVILLSVPFCEPLPAVAPVLLAACLDSKGIPAVASDFNIEFYKQFHSHLYWSSFKNFLTMGHLISPTFDRKFFKQVYRFTKSFINNLVKLHDPTHIGISIFTSESLDFGQFLSYIIRKYHPEIFIIAGGKGLEISDQNNEFHYEKWIKNFIADAVVVGDAEISVVTAITNNQTGVIISPPLTKDDLDNIPLSKWDDYDLGIYRSLNSHMFNTGESTEPYLTVTASKGCVRQCTFCDVSSFWPQYIFRDPIKVADEIIFNYKNTGIKMFQFTDNLINGSISNYRAMNQRLVEQIPNTIKYGGYAIFRGKNQMPEEDFKLAENAGCIKWLVGVESGSEKVRYDMKKKFNNDDLDWSVRMLAKYNIQQTWLLMVGYPTENENDFYETKQLLYRYQHLSYNNKVLISVTPTFMILKNSPLLQQQELAEKYGVEHLLSQPSLSDKFWTSSKFIDNDYATRSKRWKELILLAENLGYEFAQSSPIEKWKDEIKNLDQLYHEQKSRVFAIRPI
jgi:radical SAM superfamily enzyme YgiQ (UPF0313 family)